MRANMFFSAAKDGDMAFSHRIPSWETRKNRETFLHKEGVSLDQCVFSKQVHGSRIAIVRQKDIGRGSADEASALSDTDALITNIPDSAVCVQVADCVPLLLFNDRIGLAAAVHSGWRGTLKNIAGETIRKMRVRYLSNVRNTKVWIGPSIRECCFQIDENISSQVRKKGFWGLSKNNTRWNIAEACRGQLIKAGIVPKNITVAKECTACGGKSFFSYKRSGVDSGRMMAGIVLPIKKQGYSKTIIIS